MAMVPENFFIKLKFFLHVSSSIRTLLYKRFFMKQIHGGLYCEMNMGILLITSYLLFYYLEIETDTVS